MEYFFEKLNFLSNHLALLDKTFKNRNNYSSQVDFQIYFENQKKLKKIAAFEKLKSARIKVSTADEESKTHPESFSDEIYSESDRQMKLADIIEFILLSRGVYYLFQSNKFQKNRVEKFIEINLRIVNLLMIYEALTVDNRLRSAFLNNLKDVIGDEEGFTRLLEWDQEVGLNENHPKYLKSAPNEYFDSLLPKTAGGLWHELLVYCFILKYNLGYIFPLLLTQKPISLRNKLSPPDLVILHNKTFRYYGIEIGALKERQSGGFMAPSGIPVSPIDTLNARISDRCPSCNKWIGICPKVIKDFSNTDYNASRPVNEIRCLTECDIYTLDEMLEGKCKYMKFKYKNPSWPFVFANNHHHHYHCCLAISPLIKLKIKAVGGFNNLKRLNILLKKADLNIEERIEKLNLQRKLRKKYSFIKTHSIYYTELLSLFNMGQGRFANVDGDSNEIE